MIKLRSLPANTFLKTDDSNSLPWNPSNWEIFLCCSFLFKNSCFLRLEGCADMLKSVQSYLVKCRNCWIRFPKFQTIQLSCMFHMRGSPRHLRGAPGHSCWGKVSEDLLYHEFLDQPLWFIWTKFPCITAHLPHKKMQLLEVITCRLVPNLFSNGVPWYCLLKLILRVCLHLEVEVSFSYTTASSHW